MTPLSDLEYEAKRYHVLDRHVIAVLSRRVDGYSVYIGKVPGKSHSREWPTVAAAGSKIDESLAKVIAQLMGYIPNIPYAY